MVYLLTNFLIGSVRGAIAAPRTTVCWYIYTFKIRISPRRYFSFQIQVNNFYLSNRIHIRYIENLLRSNFWLMFFKLCFNAFKRLLQRLEAFYLSSKHYVFLYLEKIEFSDLENHSVFHHTFS